MLNQCLNSFPSAKMFVRYLKRF